MIKGGSRMDKQQELVNGVMEQMEKVYFQGAYDMIKSIQNALIGQGFEFDEEGMDEYLNMVKAMTGDELKRLGGKLDE